MRLRDRLIHAVLNALFERRDIVVEGELYLRRWFLGGRGTDCQTFLHHILLPDEGRELHDHPFDFSSRVLSGGYTESVADYDPETGRTEFEGFYVRKRGDDFTHGAEHTHRIASVEPGTFTLVTAGPARRAWGFWEAQGESFGRPCAPYRWVSAASRGIEPQPEDVIR